MRQMTEEFCSFTTETFNKEPMRIAYRFFTKTERSSKAKIICHGLGGHSKSETIRPIIDEALNQENDVFSIDWPYHGCSSMSFQAKPTLKDMIVSLDKLVEIVSKKKYKTIDIIGHSMGSLFAICWGLMVVSSSVQKIRKIIAMNPGFPKLQWYEKCLVRFFGKYTPFQYAHSVITHSLEWTDNIQIVEKRFQDPLELKYIQDAILIPLLDAADMIEISNENQQAVPVKIIWSEKDPIINGKVIEKLFLKSNYECLYVSKEVPYHELCTTKEIGQKVSELAIA